MNSIYINSIKHISAQKPLSDEWFDEPVQNSENYVRATDPDFKQYFAPNTARRLGKILKRALLVSQAAMKNDDVSQPDAIITGTGLGCIENTELFLDKMVREGEELLNPTQFMQSTHNTVSSLVAIEAKCHNYNMTYSHKGISFECALQDAFLQMQSGKIQNALVGAHDEMTPAYFTLLKKVGYLGQSNQTFAGESAVAMMLSNRKAKNTFCKIDAIEKVYNGFGLPVKPAMTYTGIDFVMVGTNGVAENDNIYFENCVRLFPNVPLLQYKHIFGESYTAPAFGVYAAALCLKNGKIPGFLFAEKGADCKLASAKILCYNQFEGKNHTFILLSNV
ncbi:MAG: beta-ketoacyl synthase chain length factor [Prevotellaceae bacterium]|jgi:3-oxoacyl-(acyl-carrier-protein) synthase|nr:beta-ketoacyl synthase chain length factor [Prevotellaceae bacterium]